MFYGFLYLHMWKNFRIIRLLKKKLRIFMISHQTTNCIIYHYNKFLYQYTYKYSSTKIFFIIKQKIFPLQILYSQVPPS